MDFLPSIRISGEKSHDMYTQNNFVSNTGFKVQVLQSHFQPKSNVNLALLFYSHLAQLLYGYGMANYWYIVLVLFLTWLLGVAG